MKTSTHIGGFWFHIEWYGDYGIDHRGNEWKNRSNPEPISAALKSQCLVNQAVTIQTMQVLNILLPKKFK